MKSKTVVALIASLAAGALATSASAATFLFSYTGDAGLNGASGKLTATDNGDGTFTVTGGTITGFGPSYADGVAGAMGVVIPNPNAPSSATSPMGAFVYDDQALPGQDPLISNPGLLFSVDGYEVNIFSNGPGPDTYTLQSYSTSTGYTAAANGNFALSEVAGVPEPATWGLMLAGFGLAGGAYRSSRKRALAAAA